MPCRVFRVGVFFDGTGNTKKPDSSKGKMSNIAKLSDMYKEGTFKDKLGKQTVSKMLYTNGVGTYDSDIVDYIHFIDRKYDKGGGGGGAKRIYKMIEDITALLDAHEYHKSKPNKFTKREIDVFGFSRGAAMARDFVNTFFFNYGEEEKYNDVRFNFIGLYDTVGSFGKPGNPIDLKPKKEYLGKFNESYLPKGMQLKDEEFGIRDADGNISTIIGHATNHDDLAAKVTALKAEGWENVKLIPVGGYGNYTAYTIHGTKPTTEFFEPYNFDLAQGINASAKHIYHLTAHDEVRKNFPLTDTKNAGESNSLMGVHSDIGGGYDPTMSEEFVYPTEYHSQEKALAAAESLVKEKNKNTLYAFWGWSASVEAIDYHMQTETVTLYAPKLIKRTNNRLSDVGLYLMYEEAIKHNVPFLAPSDSMPTYLKEYYQYALKTKSHAYTYGDEGYGIKVKESEMHHSSRDPAHIHDNKIATVGAWDAVIHDEPESGNDARYVDKYGRQVDGRKYPELADHVQRAVFNNISTNAIVPGESSSKA